MEVFYGPPVGPNIKVASLEEVKAAMERFSDGLPWKEVRDAVVPVFERLRPYPPAMPEALRMVVPPGVSVGFGIDTGPAFVVVSREMLDGWGLDQEAVLEKALRNLQSRAVLVTSKDVHRGTIGDVPAEFLQSGTGSASTFVLLPDEIRRIFPGPCLLIAPMRDLLVSLPIDVDRDFATWLYDEIASEDPHALAPMAFRISDGKVTLEPLGDALATA